MTDHTEREREARVALDSAYESAAVESHYDEDRYCDARNAYRAAVRAAVLAEVRSRMTRHRYGIELTDTDDGYHATMTHRADGEWVHVESLLTQLEATDGR